MVSTQPQITGGQDVAFAVVDEQDLLCGQFQPAQTPREGIGFRLGAADTTGQTQDGKERQEVGKAFVEQVRQLVRDVGKQAKTYTAFGKSKDMVHHLLVETGPARQVECDQFLDTVLVEGDTETFTDGAPVRGAVQITPVVAVAYTPVGIPEHLSAHPRGAFEGGTSLS